MKRIIHTERLAIKPYSHADEAAMIELLTNESIRETFMLPELPTRADAAAMFERLRGYSLSDGHFERGVYAEGRLIGFVCDVEMQDDAVELGYVIHPDFQNRGYATEALGAIIEALLQGGVREIRAGAFEDNAASFRVMEKCGMKCNKKEATHLYQGRTRRSRYYTICR